jgi:chromosome segregation protein
MRLKSIELSGFKSFAKKTSLEFSSAITAIVGPNGSGKSNVAEAFRFVLGEQSMKSMRSRRGEDLIWNGSSASPRAGRASVKLVFDNPQVGGRRALDLDFDEIIIERVVHRSGENDYVLNGSVVRLRDIAGLLAQTNIGSSGHHIISQGEADRILSASSRERREMLEDALGLTAYLYKREDAQRKLQKAHENMREVGALRRELAPHLKFLSSQVKKIEESQKLREELKECYAEYLRREEHYLSRARAAFAREKNPLTHELKNLEDEIASLRKILDAKGSLDQPARDLMELEAHGRASTIRREAIMRELGRIEGELAAREKLSHEEATLPKAPVLQFVQRLTGELEEALSFTPTEVIVALRKLLAHAREFLRTLGEGTPGSLKTEDLRGKKKTLDEELAHLQKNEAQIQTSVERLRKKIESERDASRAAERTLFEAMATRSQLQGKLQALTSREELLLREEAQYSQEVAEARALLGTPIVPAVAVDEAPEEKREEQAQRRKKIERLKIRLEEAGTGGGSEVLKEFQETKEREEFLARELHDLEVTQEKLQALILDLTQTLQSRFDEGVEKINAEFEAFFKLMFGGGSASLMVVKEKKLRRALPAESFGEDEEARADESDDDDAEIEEGVDIAVMLPHKRIKGLHMLSGGERALTSIALIFAMSQVNPPPFLILDETDAALDEANSRRYGDMIENLAKKSQLILITHNRETMSRAGILYGVTMGGDGVSKLLSVQFEEALAVAK